jgi:hypothetical protein
MSIKNKNEILVIYSNPTNRIEKLWWDGDTIFSSLTSSYYGKRPIVSEYPIRSMGGFNIITTPYISFKSKITNKIIKPNFIISSISKIIKGNEIIIYDAHFNKNAILLLNNLRHTDPSLYYPLSEYLNNNNPNSFGKKTTTIKNRKRSY